jgi:nucleotide-binding universal stress UspA family protein
MPIEVEQRQEAKEAAPFRRVMVAVDGSPAAARALRFAVRVAQFCVAKLAVVYVIDDTHGFSPSFAFGEGWSEREVVERGRERLGRLTEDLPAILAVERMVRTGDPSTQIIAAATEWNADVIVAGPPTHHGLARLLDPSVDGALLKRTPCSLMVVGPDGFESATGAIKTVGTATA